MKIKQRTSIFCDVACRGHLGSESESMQMEDLRDQWDIDSGRKEQICQGDLVCAHWKSIIGYAHSLCLRFWTYEERFVVPYVRYNGIQLG